MTVKSKSKSKAVMKSTGPVTPGRGDFIFPVRGKFDAASREAESSRHWQGADFLSADAAMAPSIRHIIISRARYEAANNGYCEGILKTLADDVIGTGPRLQLSLCENEEDDIVLEWETRLNRREARWRKWAKAVHLAKTLKMARRSKALDGEVFDEKQPDSEHVKRHTFEAEQVGPPHSTLTDSTTPSPEGFDGLYDQMETNSYRFGAFTLVLALKRDDGRFLHGES